MESKGTAGFRLTDSKDIWVDRLNINGKFEWGMDLSGVSNSSFSNIKINGPKSASDQITDFIESVRNASAPDDVKSKATSAALGMRFAKSRESFLENYNFFIAIVADHMAMYGPLLATVKPLFDKLLAG